MHEPYPKKRLDVDRVRQQISQLLLVCPELLDDDVLRTDMIEAETDGIEFLRTLERKRSDTRATIDVLHRVVEDLELRMGRFERREEGIRTMMHKVLDAAGLKKVELPEATLSIRAGAPKVIITDENALSEEYFRIKKEPDKILIGAVLKISGNTISGATLSNAEPHLSIRIR